MRTALVFGVLGLLCAGRAAIGAEGQLTGEARAAAAAFMGDLKGELAAALQEGGPLKAIEVCRVRAREIAAAHGEKSGFKVGRTSSKVRNPRNAPDPWEKGVLRDFESRAAKGEDVTGLERSEVVAQGGKKVFRYMKAIPMGEPCQACHGESLAPEVEARVREFYPKDRAIGFKVGDLRGAFTLEKVVE